MWYTKIKVCAGKIYSLSYSGIATMDCSFPTSSGWSKTKFDSHIYCLSFALPVAYLLFTDQKLKRFYYPLAVSAKCSIILDILGSLIYLADFSVNFEDIVAVNSCGEIVLGRLQFIVTMFAEMHLVYMLSKALGLGSEHVSIWNGASITLPQALIIALAGAVATCVYCIFERGSYGLVRNMWIIALAALQYQQIRLSKAKNKSYSEFCLISSNDPVLMMYEKLTFFQLFTATFCLGERLFFKQLFPVGHQLFNDSRLVIDSVNTLVFYFKVLLIKEKSNVEVTVGADP
jgi:hypothetical protein